MHADTKVLVEGRSDREAVVTVARVASVDLAGVEFVVLEGATKVEAFRRGRDLSAARILGLCDAGEQRFFLRVVAVDDLYVCDPDLEAELIAAAGTDLTEQVIAAHGELASLRRLQMQPQHRSRPPEQVLRRFMGSRSGRKRRYARALVEALGPDRAPAPLAGLVARIGG